MYMFIENNKSDQHSMHSSCEFSKVDVHRIHQKYKNRGI